MPKEQLLYCATDKEIYDLLIASKQSITEGILLSIARERGIFYAPRETREVLIGNLSLLPYGYADLNLILDHRATIQRTEKRTSITFNASLNMEDIKAVCAEYRDTTKDEKVTTQQDGTNKFTATINYSELDYSKTRLLQRRDKEADIEFFVKDNETTVRLPSNPKARAVIEALKTALDQRIQGSIQAEEIELTSLKTPEARTTFFTSLISQLSGYKLHNVMDVKVESKLHDPAPDLEDVDAEDEDEGEETDEGLAAKETMLSVVENIALKGSLLLSSPEYQQLRQKGFYITSIVWTAQQVESPNDIVEFDAGFELPREGKGFKYNVRGLYRNINGTPTKTLRQIPKEQKPPYFSLLEGTARRVLKSLGSPSPEVDGKVA